MKDKDLLTALGENFGRQRMPNSTTLYCTVRDRDRLMSGHWSTAMQRRADRALSSTCCEHCGGSRRKLARVLSEEVDRSTMVATSCIVVAVLCLGCRAVEPINCSIDQPPEMVIPEGVN